MRSIKLFATMVGTVLGVVVMSIGCVIAAGLALMVGAIVHIARIPLMFRRRSW